MKGLFKLLILIIYVINLNYCKSTSGEDNAKNEEKVATQLLCIEQIMASDDSLGRIRNHACENISLSETIANYIGSLEALNYEDCPKAFTESFKQHIAAWKSITKMTDHYSGLRGEMHDLFKEIEEGDEGEEFKELVKSIWDTWADVEQSIAVQKE
jgi:hypothetical protein